MNILVNGKYRNYTSIQIDLLGISAEGHVKAIDYKTADSIDPVKVLGTKKAVGYTQGDEVNEANITLTSEFLDELQRALQSGKTIKDIPPFPVAISYVDNNSIQVAHALIGCKFKENGRSGESGSNDALTQQIPLFVFDINFNA
ncbi:hypothetical protein MAR621_03123 [Maribacter dokdonensis]|uniref:hypothetical protein n=1 Tax=Maribacter dokdonensis TaxID=320912 RepID=UPI001B07E6ED|nr:hypothetical protein [Maribacter dokdonensis]CAG2532929.1 hypothetical protein MAR621_03123 [Maribacter dokdonensis]